MSKFITTVTNGVEDYTLIFDLNETDIANKWAAEINKGYSIFEDWRFTGWPDSEWNEESYIQKMNECINTINEYQPGIIQHNAYVGMPQETTNILHKYFETLRGGVLTPTTWYDTAPDNVKTALTNYNVYIHNYEKLMLGSEYLSSTITCTFNSQRQLLDETDYKYFTYNWKFGTVYINYCEVGKHLLEMFVDNDNDIVGDQNIRPLKYYSSDFKIKFCSDIPGKEFVKFSSRLHQWLLDNTEKFKALGIEESSYNLGLIPVAVLNYAESNLENLTQKEIIYKLSKFNRVKSVRIIA